MAAGTTISDSELDVLKVLWKNGPSTVRTVHDSLRRRKKQWAYNTVATLLIRLKEKGYVAAEKEGVALVYQAVISRDKLLKRRLADLADRVCDGTSSPLVHALIQGRKFSPTEIEDLRKMIDELDR